MKATDLQLGQLRMSASEASHRLTCVQFAVDNEDIVALCSVAGPQTSVKALAAAFNQNIGLWLYGEGFEWTDGGSRSGPIRSNRGFQHADGQGQYKVTMHRLGFNYVHCTAIRKDPRLLPVLSDEALWRVLTSSRFTTPLLREWVPTLAQMMKDECLLERLVAFNCQPAHLTLTTEALDELVSKGIREGKLRFPERRVA